MPVLPATAGVLRGSEVPHQIEQDSRNLARLHIEFVIPYPAHRMRLLLGHQRAGKRVVAGENIGDALRKHFLWDVARLHMSEVEPSDVEMVMRVFLPCKEAQERRKQQRRVLCARLQRREARGIPPPLEPVTRKEIE